jgi:hypothetical protein
MNHQITEAQRQQLLETLKDTTGLPSSGARAFDTRIENIRMLQSLDPVKGAPHAWMIQGSHATWKGEFAEQDAKAEAKRCGGTCYAYPLYAHPQRELSDEEIKSMWQQYCGYPGGIFDFARAVLEKARFT